MKILQVHLDEESGEVTYQQVKHAGRGIFPDYPILIQANGLPWTLGNIYLLKRMEHAKKYEPKTWQNLSNDLLHYLRWIEDNNINPLFFPMKQKFNRPTHKYRDYLIEEVNGGRTSLNTASTRINSIINFYRGLAAYNIINSDILELAWDTKEVLLRIIIGRDFSSRHLSINSTDLAIRKPTAQDNANHIRDGGQLRPLSNDEQTVLSQYIRTSSTNHRLMFSIAILTGARLQTICTLRGKTLEDALHDEPNNRYLIHVGGNGSCVDTKQSKALTIIIPAKLYDSLIQHWHNNESIIRRLKSFYGNVESNYLFLTKNGEPYITSKTEKLDRRDPNVHRRVGIEGAMSKTANPRNGQAIWTFIKNLLLPRIRIDHPDFADFSFHDLRATFGMNTLETLLRAIDRQNEDLKKNGKEHGYGIEWALEQVQERLGHNDLKVTMRYLNFKRNHQFHAKLQTSIEDQLMKYIPDDVLNYDND